MRIALNSKTSGGYRVKTLNGREHITTHMVPIVGDSVMNGIFYPDDEVTNSYTQLDSLPAPNGHPKVNGKSVSAFHPLAINAFNIGAFVRAPKKTKKMVKNQLWVDVEIANRSEEGKELIRRIKSSEKVGVSTGLKVSFENSEGSHNGTNYRAIARDYQFDHVAVLLNEQAAGEHVGTELVYNADDANSDNILVCNVDVENELAMDDIYGAIQKALKDVVTSDSYFYIEKVYPESKKVVYKVESQAGEQMYSRSYSTDQNDKVSLNDDAQAVMRKVQYEPETQTMENSKMKLDEAKQVVADAGLIVLNETDHKALADKADSVEALNAQVAEMQPIVDAHNAAVKAEREEVVNTIITNSEMKAEDLESLSLNALNSLATTVTKAVKKPIDRSAQHTAEYQENSQEQKPRNLSAAFNSKA